MTIQFFNQSLMRNSSNFVSVFDLSFGSVYCTYSVHSRAFENFKKKLLRKKIIEKKNFNQNIIKDVPKLLLSTIIILHIDFKNIQKIK